MLQDVLECWIGITTYNLIPVQNEPNDRNHFPSSVINGEASDGSEIEEK